MAFVLQSLRQTSEQQRSLTRPGGDNLMPLINTVTRPTPVIFPRWFSNISSALWSLQGVENSHCLFCILVAWPCVICGIRPAYGTGLSPNALVFSVSTIPQEVHTHTFLCYRRHIAYVMPAKNFTLWEQLRQNLICTRATWTSIQTAKKE